MVIFTVSGVVDMRRLKEDRGSLEDVLDDFRQDKISMTVGRS